MKTRWINESRESARQNMQGYSTHIGLMREGVDSAPPISILEPRSAKGIFCITVSGACGLRVWWCKLTLDEMKKHAESILELLPSIRHGRDSVPGYSIPDAEKQAVAAYKKEHNLL